MINKFSFRPGIRCHAPIARFEHESDDASAPGHRKSREPDGGVEQARTGNRCGGVEINCDFNKGGRNEPSYGEGPRTAGEEGEEG